MGKVTTSNFAILTKFEFLEPKITFVPECTKKKCFEIIMKIHQAGEKLQVIKVVPDQLFELRFVKNVTK